MNRKALIQQIESIRHLNPTCPSPSLLEKMTLIQLGQLLMSLDIDEGLTEPDPVDEDLDDLKISAPLPKGTWVQDLGNGQVEIFMTLERIIELLNLKGQENEDLLPLRTEEWEGELIINLLNVELVLEAIQIYKKGETLTLYQLNPFLVPVFLGQSLQGSSEEKGEEETLDYLALVIIELADSLSKPVPSNLAQSSESQKESWLEELEEALNTFEDDGETYPLSWE